MIRRTTHRHRPGPGNYPGRVRAPITFRPSLDPSLRPAPDGSLVVATVDEYNNFDEGSPILCVVGTRRRVA
jgi:hypothetical protein